MYQANLHSYLTFIMKSFTSGRIDFIQRNYSIFIRILNNLSSLGFNICNRGAGIQRGEYFNKVLARRRRLKAQLEITIFNQWEERPELHE